MRPRRRIVSYQIPRYDVRIVRIVFAVSLFAALSLCIFGQHPSAPPGGPVSPVHYQRYRIEDQNISVVLPKLPLVHVAEDTCKGQVLRSYRAYAEEAVYELTLFETKLKLRGKCPAEMRSEPDTPETRAGFYRSQKFEKESAATDERKIFTFYREGNERRIIEHPKDSSRFIELAVFRRKDAPADPAKYFDSLEFDSADGIPVGKGADVVLGDADVTSSDSATVASADSSPIVFVSKPRAVYTDAARSNSIQGNVTLRVTFNKNGSVGSIQTVAALPFGLTEQAIAAARKLVFLPKRANGVPITATMSVQYSFTIY